jgi:hypothetical protein
MNCLLLLSKVDAFHGLTHGPVDFEQLGADAARIGDLTGKDAFGTGVRGSDLRGLVVDPFDALCELGGVAVTADMHEEHLWLIKKK